MLEPMAEIYDGANRLVSSVPYSQAGREFLRWAASPAPSEVPSDGDEDFRRRYAAILLRELS